MSSAASDNDYSIYIVSQLKTQLRQRNIPFRASDRKQDLVRLLSEADDAESNSEDGSVVNQEEDANNTSRRSSATESIQRDHPPKGHNPNSNSSSKSKKAGPKSKASRESDTAEAIFSKLDGFKSYLWPLLTCAAFFLVFLSTFLAILVLVFSIFQAWAPVKSISPPGIEGKSTRRLSRFYWFVFGLQIVMLSDLRSIKRILALVKSMIGKRKRDKDDKSSHFSNNLAVDIATSPPLYCSLPSPSAPDLYPPSYESIPRRWHSTSSLPASRSFPPSYGLCPSHSAHSVPPPDCLALTEDNLRLHTVMTTPELVQPAAPSDQSEKGSSDPLWKLKSIKSEKLLDLYNIHLDRGQQMEPDLLTVLQDVKKLRGGDATPVSIKITERWRISRDLSEKDAQALLENVLGYRGEYEDTEIGVRCEAGIMRSRDHLWKKDCLPIPSAVQGKVFQDIFEKAGLPSVPKPDLTYGYTFTSFEEKTHRAILMLPDSANPLGGQPYFPYWIIEWKSSYNGGTIEEAATQARRDGSAAVFTMLNLYRILGVEEPAQETTAVFTTCIDSNQVLTRIHWRRCDPITKAVTYEADIVDQGFISKPRDMFDFRSLVFNILHWAREIRLPAIQRALEDGGERITSLAEMSPKKKGESPNKRQKTYVIELSIIIYMY
ncbi:MAG: hypothetical protein Q9218_006872 [Villophora microphyllina]